MGGHREGKTLVLTQTLRATLVVSLAPLQYRVILDPSYSDLHRVLHDEGEDKLWEVLLKPKGAEWESFR